MGGHKLVFSSNETTLFASMESSTHNRALALQSLLWHWSWSLTDRSRHVSQSLWTSANNNTFYHTFSRFSNQKKHLSTIVTKSFWFIKRLLKHILTASINWEMQSDIIHWKNISQVTRIMPAIAISLSLTFSLSLSLFCTSSHSPHRRALQGWRFEIHPLAIIH